MRVLRVQLEVVDYQLISLPVPDTLLRPIIHPILHLAPCHSGDQRIDAWFEEPETPARRRDVGIYLMLTGEPMPKELWEYRQHIGSVQVLTLMWHVYEGPVQL